MMTKDISPIGYIKNNYKEKFGIPRQAGINNTVESEIVFLKPFSDSSFFDGIEKFSHIWVIWGFSENDEKYSSKVKPPRLGGNRKVGVFATRSPYRPNNLGLSCVRIKEIRTGENVSIVVSGADMMDGTPVYDIKPYLPEFDSVEDAVNLLENEMKSLEMSVEADEGVFEGIDSLLREEIISVLRNDPRPQYKAEKRGDYAFRFSDLDIRFRVTGDTVRIYEIVPVKGDFRKIK